MTAELGRRFILHCKWSKADGWRKGALVGAQKDVIWRVFLEREVH